MEPSDNSAATVRAASAGQSDGSKSDSNESHTYKSADDLFVGYVRFTKETYIKCMELPLPRPNRDSIGYRGSMGLLVKMYKLHQAIVRNSVENEGLAVEILLRVYYETFVSLRYLLQYYEKENFDEFILTDDMRIRDLILQYEKAPSLNKPEAKEIRERSIQALMQELIAHERNIDELPKGYARSWHRELSYTKMAEALEGEDSYGTFRMFYNNRSKSVHPSWSDISKHHIRYTPEDGFRPNLNNDSNASMAWGWLICTGLQACDSFARRFDGTQEMIDLINNVHDKYHKDFPPVIRD